MEQQEHTVKSIMELVRQLAMEDASYRKFSRKNGNRLVQIKGGKWSIMGIYHIQLFHAYHSKLKSFLGTFKGVASKYLNNYLTWNNMIEHRSRSLSEKATRLLGKVATALFEETRHQLPLKPSLPLLVKTRSQIKLLRITLNIDCIKL